MAEPKDNIKGEELAQALGDRYLTYALSTITQRAPKTLAAYASDWP